MEKDIAELIGEIMKVSVLINLQGKHNCFVSDRGHVKNIEIRLHIGGWKSNADADLSDEISYARKESIKPLRKVRDTLYKIYKNGKINMGNCKYEIEEVKHYKFY